MTITLPDIPGTPGISPEELRLELACALHARGRIGKIGAAELAGVDLFAFQRALMERGQALYSDSMLAEDLQSLRALFQ